MVTLCKCTQCSQIFIDDNPQNPYALRWDKVPKSIKKIYHSMCPLCLTDEYIEEITQEEILTANSKKEVEELADKHYPDYLYLKTTTRGTGRHWKLHNYIYVK